MSNAAIDIKVLNGVQTISFVDSRILDDTNINRIGEELFQVVEDNEHVKIVLDFGNVDYLSSAVLGKLVALHKKVAKATGTLILCNIKPSIMEIFKITKLVKVFSIHETLDEASAAASG